MLTGIIKDGVHRLDLRVYYEDTDFSGVVYHANYLKYCERARSDFIRLLNINQNQLFGAEDGFAFAIRRMTCEFIKPARFDDVLTVESVPGEMTGVRFFMQQRVVRGADVLFTAEAMAVLIDGQGRPKRIPSALVEAFLSVKS
jgi:acyl-CoA thioester hydrolase